MKNIKIIDTTLRDAQQCLWATRMTTAMMLPVAEKLDRAGFDMIDFMAPVQFDVCVRYLKENPWEKARLLRKKFANTPLRGYVRSKSLIGFNLVPDDIVELWVERLWANGFKVVGTLDALFDTENMLVSIRHAKRIGMYSIGSLVFCESPVHTDEVYARTAKTLIEKGGVDAIMIKDSGALLTPDRIRTLVPALKKVMGKIPLELHSHCNTGLAPLVYLEAVKLGVDKLHTSIAPLANGPAQPATQTTVRNLASIGYTPGLRGDLINEVSDYLTRLAAQEHWPEGAPMEYETFQYQHQMPGGMLANFKFQLQQAGILDKLDQILEEIANIRVDLGWPIMVTPFSQIIGVQAMLNVVHGERYKVVPDEVKKYALGHYGKLLAPVNPDVLDKIVENGSGKIPLQAIPLGPAVPALRKKYTDADDDELLLRYMFVGQEVDQLIAAGPINQAYSLENPLLYLLKELQRRPRFKSVYVRKNQLSLTVNRAA